MVGDFVIYILAARKINIPPPPPRYEIVSPLQNTVKTSRYPTAFDMLFCVIIFSCKLATSTMEGSAARKINIAPPPRYEIVSPLQNTENNQ